MDHASDPAYSPTEAEVKSYCMETGETAIPYGVVENNANVVAAAIAIHGLKDLSDLIPGFCAGTGITDIAVSPDRQGEGHGKRLIRHIAIRAMNHGDQLLSLYALTEEVEGFFRKMGFSGSEIMQADAAEILNR